MKIAASWVTACLALTASSSLSQTAAKSSKHAGRATSTFSSRSCGISFQHDSLNRVAEVPVDNENSATDICKIAVHVVPPPADKEDAGIAYIRVLRGSLEQAANQAGFDPDPDHAGEWTYHDVTGDEPAAPEKNERWTGLDADYSVRLFDENGYRGMGEAEILVACNGRGRCVIFNSEDLGEAEFAQIKKTLRFLAEGQ